MPVCSFLSCPWANIKFYPDMYNSKLYNILKNFDKYEQNRCRKYIKSPYFNRSPQLTGLYEQLVKEVNAVKKTGLSKEQLWNTLQPDKPYDDVRFRKYCSDLQKLIEGYLQQEIYRDNPLEQSAHLMQAVRQKNLQELFNTATRSAKYAADKFPFRSAQYYLNQYEVEQSFYDMAQSETNRHSRSNIEKISENLDVFYLAEKLRLLCGAITQKKLTSVDYDFFLMDEIIEKVKVLNLKDKPPIALYYQIYLTLKEAEKEEHYFKLKRLLNTHGLKFPTKEAREILYMAAQNYCIGKINQGNHKFTLELFQLYEDLINKEILFKDGEFSPWYFKNIVLIALRLGKYKWTERFINQYSSLLPEAFRENAVTFNLARVYWYQKKHEKVIELLRDVEYDDVAYALGARAILLATYYETDEIEPLYSLMESFRAFLNRHKDIPDKRRKNYKNLIKFTKKLTKIRYGDQDAIKKLRKEIEASEGVADAKWLNEQIAELEGTPKLA